MSWANLSCSRRTGAAQHWSCSGNVVWKGFTLELDLCFRKFTVSQDQRNSVQEGKKAVCPVLRCFLRESWARLQEGLSGIERCFNECSCTGTSGLSRQNCCPVKQSEHQCSMPGQLKVCRQDELDVPPGKHCEDFQGISGLDSTWHMFRGLKCLCLLQAFTVE